MSDEEAEMLHFTVLEDGDKVTAFLTTFVTGEQALEHYNSYAVQSGKALAKLLAFEQVGPGVDPKAFNAFLKIARSIDTFDPIGFEFNSLAAVFFAMGRKFQLEHPDAPPCVIEE